MHPPCRGKYYYNFNEMKKTRQQGEEPRCFDIKEVVRLDIWPPSTRTHVLASKAQGLSQSQ
jgi:hypothetical protein